MADDSTPDTPASEQATPAPRRRAAPRKTGERKTPTRKPSTRTGKSAVARAEEAVGRAATTVKDAVVDVEQRAVRAVKPRAVKRTATRVAAGSGTRGGGTKANGRSRAKADDGTTPAKTRKASGGRPRKNDRSTLERATDRIGGKWAAALAGVAAAGATAAAVLTLRGSTPRPTGAKQPANDENGRQSTGTSSGTGAHQPDGTDSSASFQAGIADESTIPDQL